MEPAITSILLDCGQCLQVARLAGDYTKCLAIFTKQHQLVVIASSIFHERIFLVFYTNGILMSFQSSLPETDRASILQKNCLKEGQYFQPIIFRRMNNDRSLIFFLPSQLMLVSYSTKSPGKANIAVMVTNAVFCCSADRLLHSGGVQLLPKHAGL